MSFTPEALDETDAKIRAFLAKYYPEYKYRAFFCGSWLLDPTLVDLLGEETNISKFCKRFIPFGVKSAGTSPFGYVFHTYGNDINISALPEDSRLQRLLKKHYLEGKSIYDIFGVFF